MEKQLKQLVVVGASFAFLSVVFGAFGAHALKGLLSEYAQGVYQTAVEYQMFHSLAILFLGLSIKDADETSMKWRIRSFYSFVFGLLFFCGSLYILAITDIKWLGAITPIGGTAFLVGWGLLIYSFLAVDKVSNPK